MLNWVIFEDQFVGDAAPLTTPRPACAVTCGTRNLYQAVKAFGEPVEVVMRDYLRPVFSREFPAVPASAGPALHVNASLVPETDALERLAGLARDGRPFMATHGCRVSAAYAPDGALPEGARSPEAISACLIEKRLPLLDEELPTIDYSFDVVRHHMRIFSKELDARVEQGAYRKVADNVYVGEGVRIAETAVLHAEEGPIVLEDGVRIMDFAYLVGPLLIGPSSRVIERSSVKEGVRIGHTCKIGGEVEESVIEDYTNKQHHGFLGHSYVGSWVNLGAGTSNSDLKNTYGMVRAQVGGKRVDTGMQFFGCVIGDYSKSAINTSIFTGKIIGVGSMLYGFVTSNVPSFCNFARSFGQVTEVAPDTAVDMQRRMFARRDVDQTPEHAELIREICERTRNERAMATEPLSL